MVIDRSVVGTPLGPMRTARMHDFEGRQVCAAIVQYAAQATQ